MMLVAAKLRIRRAGRFCLSFWKGVFPQRGRKGSESSPLLRIGTFRAFFLEVVRCGQLSLRRREAASDNESTQCVPKMFDESRSL